MESWTGTFANAFTNIVSSGTLAINGVLRFELMTGFFHQTLPSQSFVSVRIVFNDSPFTAEYSRGILASFHRNVQ